ncbi:MAG: methyltransferase domain-containing protein [Nanoarchaeota archaeon]|mgnify:CR=1 FL=1
MKSDSALEILACPDCKNPFSGNSSGTYFCRDQEYSPTNGITNLLPLQTRNSSSAPFKRIAKKGLDVNLDGLSIGISADDLNSFLLNATFGMSRGILSHIRKIIESGLPNECYESDRRITAQGVKLVSSLFNKIVQKCKNNSDDHFLGQLTGALHQARYEAELESMRDYAGNFELPLKVRKVLPKKGNIVELAMGNGANLQQLVREGNFERSVGFDYSYGMVRAAMEHDQYSSTFYAIADAHNVPLRDKFFDLVLMFNALDRVRDPD